MPLSSIQLSRLVDQHWGTLCAWLGPASGQVDDIVQEAFIKLAAQEPPPENCLAWLLTVTRRLAINVQVAERRRREREKIAGQIRPCPEPGSDGNKMKLDVQSHLDELTDQQRQILVARIWGQLSFEQIADVLGSSKSSVYRSYQNSIQILKQTMRDS